jgi:glycosyltransferase involved in cell wall biosynthesis
MTLQSVRADVLMVPSADDVYDKPRLVRASADVHFYGPTHEALLGGSRASLAGAVFDELPKTDAVLARKFARDVDVLLDFIAENEGDPRWWFYLGGSLEGLGKKTRAAEAYRRCVELRRVGDEAAWAAYRQADMLYQLGRHEEAIAAAARGLGANPLFAECAWMAAVIALKLGRREQAVAWARTAEGAGLYNGCGTQRSFFRYPPALYELPYDVLRFALPDEEGREQANQDYQAALHARFGVSSDLELDQLSVSRMAPRAKREEARTLLRPERIHTTCPSARFTPIDFKPPKGWRSTNPSICRHKGALWCVVRTVNYEVKGGQYVSDTESIRTENYLGRFRRDGRLIGMRKMRDRDPSPRQPSQVTGYEDVRLASVGGELRGSATVHDRGGVKVVELEFDRGDVKRARIRKSSREVEKNWMPLSRGSKLDWIYSLDPTIVLSAGSERSCPFRLEHLRGGAVTEFEDGYLAVTHEVIEEPNGRIYLHRFVRLNKKFTVTVISPAFVFAHYGIEFAAGLVRDGSKLVLSFGIEDREAWIMRVDVEEVEKMLFKADAWQPPRAPVTSPATKPRLAVQHSPHERCGIHEYGIELDAALLRSGEVDLVKPEELRAGDTLLVHFEPGLMTEKVCRRVLNSSARRVFCCHWFAPDVVGKWPEVDKFVVHRDYSVRNPKVVEIPLGCPPYEPSGSVADIRDRFGIPQDRLVVTTVGFLAAWKQLPELARALAVQTDELREVFVNFQTPLPFLIVNDEELRLRISMHHFAPGAYRYSTDFLSRTDLADLVYASDLGFVFHPADTGSVSAAVRQFTSSRCPLVVNSSSHSSDLRGVERVNGFDLETFTRMVVRTALNKERLVELKNQTVKEYERINMDAVAAQYLSLFRSL